MNDYPVAGVRCERCREILWRAPAPQAWLGRHAHGTGETIYMRVWLTMEDRPRGSGPVVLDS